MLKEEQWTCEGCGDKHGVMVPTKGDLPRVYHTQCPKRQARKAIPEYKRKER